MAEPPRKGDQAFRTIGELADELGLPQHILRYWETRFPQLRPLQRAGNRRYYRPADVALAKRIHHLLNDKAYTIRGVQRVLADGATAAENDAPEQDAAPGDRQPQFPAAGLRDLRRRLSEALAGDAGGAP